MSETLRQSKLESKINLLWPQLVDTQEWWRAQHGEYCQIVHKGNVPNGDDEVDSPLTTSNPTDRPWTARDFWRRAFLANSDQEEDETVEHRGKQVRKKFTRGENVLTAIRKFRSAVAVDIQGNNYWTLRVQYKRRDDIFRYTRGRDDDAGTWEQLQPLEP